MKKTYFLLLLLSISLSSFACAICGCGGSSVYLGLFPSFRSSFIGLRYNYSQYHTQLANDPSQFSTNYYNTVELWGGYNVGPRFRVLGFVPYHLNKQVDDDGTSYKNGLGDLSLMGQYQVFDITHTGSKYTVAEQQLWLGGGIKLPTGNFNVDPHDSSTTISDINAQIGTGSVDFVLNGMYSYTIGNWGLTGSALYKINTNNNSQYKFGNQLSTNLVAYHRFLAGSTAISPNLGIGYEQTASNLLKKDAVQYTGSHLVNAMIGAEAGWKGMTVGLSIQVPVEQRFAEGQTRQQVKAMLHCSFSL